MKSNISELPDCMYCYSNFMSENIGQTVPAEVVKNFTKMLMQIREEHLRVNNGFGIHTHCTGQVG